MPNGDFQKQLATWEKEAQTNFELANQGADKLADLAQQLSTARHPSYVQTEEEVRRRTGLTEFRYPSWMQPGTPFRYILEFEARLGVGMGPIFGTSAMYTMLGRADYNRIKAEIATIESETNRAELYFRVYREVPQAVVGGKLLSTDEVLNALPQNLLAELSDAELGEMRDIIDDMFAEILGIKQLPEMAAEGVMPEMPELVPPTEVTTVTEPLTMANITNLTVDEIRRTLLYYRGGATARIEPVMSDGQWKALMEGSGYDEADLEEVNEMEQQAEDIINSWVERDNQLDAFKQGMAEMPDYRLIDLMKEMVVQPGLALAEAAGYYFEHVSQPLAGLAYKGLYPDMEAAYQKFRTEDSTWYAAGQAWREWDAPGDGAWSWILKYIIMEGAVDPLSYVGWGIFTKIARPIPYVGRFVGAAERGFMEVMDIPFAGMKMLWGKMPKTIAQRGLIAAHEARQYSIEWVTKYAGKPITEVTTKEFDRAVGAAVSMARRYPMRDHPAVRAGEQFLKSMVIDEDTTLRWAGRAGTLLGKDDVTRVTIENLNNVFDDYFYRKLITKPEAAGQIGRILGVTSPSDDVAKLLQRFVQEREAVILNSIKNITGQRTPYQALMKLGDRNFKIYTATQDSLAYLARKEVGRYSATLQDVGVRLQTVWRTKIDKYIVRPFAEAYLAFGLYGPMNALEDYIRSALGSVRPGRAGPREFARQSVGLSVDPELIFRESMSETFGPIKRVGERADWNNWILQCFGLAKKWGAKVYERLVELPGAYGMDARRNFVLRRYLQILKLNGGDVYDALVRIEPRVLKLGDKKLAEQITNEVAKLKLAARGEVVLNSLDDFTRKKVVRREVADILLEHPDVSNTARGHIMSDYDSGEMFRVGHESIDATLNEASDRITAEFIQSPERAAENIRGLADMLTQFDFRKPEELAQAMYSINMMSCLYDTTPRQVMKNATIRSRGLPLAERRGVIDADLDRTFMFIDRSKADINRVVDKIKAAFKEIELPDEYILRSESYLDILVAKAERAADLRVEQMTWRHNTFAGLKKKDLTNKFWDDFYNDVDNFWRLFDDEMVSFDDKLHRLSRAIDEAGGIKYPTRAPIRVINRSLTPQDVSTLMGCRVDDITNNLLSEICMVQDRNRFVTYVSGYVKPDDVGFSREAIGNVYDQIINSLHIKPETLSWMTSQRLQLDAVRKDVHSLYNAKLLPKEDIAEIKRYITDTARMVDDLVYEPAVAPVRGVIYKTSPIEDVAAIRSGERLFAEQGVDTFKHAIKGRTVPKNLVIEEIGGGSEVLYLRKNVAEVAPKIARLKEMVGTPATIGKVRERGRLFGYSEADIDEFLRVTGAVAAPTPRVKKPQFTDWDATRQASMDEAHKWYYKEYTDYTNANVFDAMMKSVYPYWTYESQRWFWLPRSFLQHPGTFMAFERWQNNSDYGYIHIPGTSMDINPFRGTIYGTLTTRLVRRDYPEYYDALGPAGGYVEFMDFLSRYGFYPGAHMALPLTAFGGLEAQYGETLPAIWKTPLNALIAAMPDNESVKFISDHIFSDRFRDYLTIVEVTKRGGDGTLIWTKLKEGLEVTEVEQNMWDESRQEAAMHGMMFEQFGMFRLRTDEQYKMYEEASKVIEELTGYTSDEQDWLRRHGYNIWDLVGGMSPTQQSILQEMDYYRWVGMIRPLLPSRQQLELNRLEISWEEVRIFSEGQLDKKLSFQSDFLAGRIGPDQYLGEISSLYREQQSYIDQKMLENPLMTLDGRKEYYKRYDIVAPVMHPMKELLNLYFSIELMDKIEPETGHKVKDWDTFWAMRDAITDAIPVELKEEWDDYVGRNSTRMEALRRETTTKYFKTYNNVWDGILAMYPENEQALIREYLSLKQRGMAPERQQQIKDTVSVHTNKKLISSFTTDCANARAALRATNPHLDARLYYWGRTTTFKTPEARIIYDTISRETGRNIYYYD